VLGKKRLDKLSGRRRPFDLRPHQSSTPMREALDSIEWEDL
jgi:hypothetical protein